MVEISGTVETDRNITITFDGIALILFLFVILDFVLGTACMIKYLVM